MVSLLTVIAAFVVGTLVGTRYEVYSSGAVRLVNDALNKYPAKCADVYAGYPLSPVYQMEDIEVAKHPIPGLVVTKLHGYRQHGMRTFEVFQNMLAPGVGTPIHSQNMNEIVLVLKGQGLAKLQDKDGKVVEIALPLNSTVNILPNVRHQLINTGTEDWQILAVNDNPPFQMHTYKGWEDKSSGTLVKPMIWDKQCPSRVPDSMRHLVVGSGTAGGSKAEL